jgi:hypothetical protein
MFVNSKIGLGNIALFKDLEKELSIIRKIGHDEGTEIGEYYLRLVSLAQRQDMMSEEFSKAFEEEVIGTYNFIKENYKLVKGTEKITLNRPWESYVFIDELPDQENGITIEDIE